MDGLRRLWLHKRLCKFFIKLLRRASERAEAPKSSIYVLSKGARELIIDSETAEQRNNVQKFM